MTEIFRAYDIRGIFPEELNEEIVYKIGKAFVKFMNTKEVLVGRDGRLSSPQLFEALAKGITESGADVIDVGLCSTPMFYYAAAKAPSSIMVTASHNPKEYNGLKLCREHAIPISGDTGIQEIREIFEKRHIRNLLDVVSGFIDCQACFLGSSSSQSSSSSSG